MKANLETMFFSIQEMTKETNITRQQQIHLAKEMLEFYKNHLILFNNNEEQAKMQTLLLLEGQIEDLMENPLKN